MEKIMVSFENTEIDQGWFFTRHLFFHDSNFAHRKKGYANFYQGLWLWAMKDYPQRRFYANCEGIRQHCSKIKSNFSKEEK